jgi:hypothetical protein
MMRDMFCPSNLCSHGSLLTKRRRRGFCVNGESASRMKARQFQQRLSLDVALFAFVGLVLAEMGPYRTLEAPQLVRTAYWLLAVFGAGMAGALTGRLVARRARGFWVRIAVASMVATLPVTLYITP